MQRRPLLQGGHLCENEKNINTVAASITDDHWSGLNETLCAGYYTGECEELPSTCIAAEMNELISKKVLTVPSSVDGEVPRKVPLNVTGCFDLVAARGFRGGRGRCACHVEVDNSAAVRCTF